MLGAKPEFMQNFNFFRESVDPEFFYAQEHALHHKQKHQSKHHHHKKVKTERLGDDTNQETPTKPKHHRKAPKVEKIAESEREAEEAEEGSVAATLTNGTTVEQVKSIFLLC